MRHAKSMHNFFPQCFMLRHIIACLILNDYLFTIFSFFRFNFCFVQIRLLIERFEVWLIHFVFQGDCLLLRTWFAQTDKTLSNVKSQFVENVFEFAMKVFILKKTSNVIIAGNGKETFLITIKKCNKVNLNIILLNSKILNEVDYFTGIQPWWLGL